MRLIFEWDGVKEKANLKKHKVSFEEAKTILSTPSYLPSRMVNILEPRSVISILAFLPMGAF